MPYSKLQVDYVVDKSGYEDRILYSIDDLYIRWDDYFDRLPKEDHQDVLDDIAEMFDQEILFVYNGEKVLPEEDEYGFTFDKGQMIHHISVFNKELRDWDVYKIDDDGQGNVSEEQINLIPEEVRNVWLMMKEMKYTTRYSAFLVNKQGCGNALKDLYDNICRTYGGSIDSSDYFKCSIGNLQHTFKINSYDYESG